MRVPKRTTARLVALRVLDERGPHDTDELAVSLYEASTWKTRASAQQVANGLLEHGLARELVSGRLKITADGRRFSQEIPE